MHNCDKYILHFLVKNSTVHVTYNFTSALPTAENEGKKEERKQSAIGMKRKREIANADSDTEEHKVS
jgi:hypothetical protein